MCDVILSERREGREREGKGEEEESRGWVV
jgi:hypothetical protein